MAQTDATPTLEEAKDRFLSAGDKAPNYRSGLKRAIDEFEEQLPSSIGRVDEIQKRHLGNYASYLSRRVDAGRSDDSDEGIEAGSAWTYYDNVSAFLAYCVRWDWLPDNPAQKEVSLGEMPSRPSSNSRDQQFWQPEDRRDLVRFADGRARVAIDEKGMDALWEIRDRALVYVLAYSGVRGGEILSDPRDDERNGVTWADADLEENQILVLGKDREINEVVLPPRTHGPLERLESALQPPSDDWPVFPTNHAPSLHGAVPDDVEDPDGDPLDVLRNRDVAPPSLSTNGARSLLQSFCEEAGIDVDEDYLQPHGARRGVGEKIYRTQGPAPAQRTLRHQDPETTSNMYSHIETGDLAEDVEEAFDGE